MDCVPWYQFLTSTLSVVGSWTTIALLFQSKKVLFQSIKVLFQSKKCLFSQKKVSLQSKKVPLQSKKCPFSPLLSALLKTAPCPSDFPAPLVIWWSHNYAKSISLSIIYSIYHKLQFGVFLFMIDLLAALKINKKHTYSVKTEKTFFIAKFFFFFLFSLYIR